MVTHHLIANLFPLCLQVILIVALHAHIASVSAQRSLAHSCAIIVIDKCSLKLPGVIGRRVLDVVVEWYVVSW